MASINRGVEAAPDSVSTSAVEVCAKAAAKAGFSYTSTVSTAVGPEREIAVAVAIAMAESSCNPSAQLADGPTNGCPDGSVDRGLWQVNSCYQPEVSNACAYQVQCNPDAAWNVSDHGADWTPWSTFTNGAWENYISTAKLCHFRLFLPIGGPSGR